MECPPTLVTMAVWDLVLETEFEERICSRSLTGHMTAVFSHGFTATSSLLIPLSSQIEEKISRSIER